MTRIAIRPARADEADFLLPLINRATEGLAEHMWLEMADQGQDPWDWARQRMQAEGSGICWRKAWVAEADSIPAGCLFAYAIGDEPVAIDPDDDPLFTPLAELENMAPGTGYVFVLSTLREFRGLGVGSRLLQFAEQRFRGRNGMSLIVADNNQRAKALYERNGYQKVATRPIVKGSWQSEGQNWVLMIKP